MATVIRSSSGIKDNASFTAMDTLILNYWGAANEEKIFPIPLWKLKQLFNAFPDTEVALHVTDIKSRALVDAEWTAFDDSLGNVLQNQEVQPGDYYFVLSEADFAELRKGAAGIAENLVIVSGRIGKTTTTIDVGGQSIQKDTFYSFIYVGTNKFEAPPGSGQGASTGYKIPAT